MSKHSPKCNISPACHNIPHSMNPEIIYQHCMIPCSPLFFIQAVIGDGIARRGNYKLYCVVWGLYYYILLLQSDEALSKTEIYLGIVVLPLLILLWTSCTIVVGDSGFKPEQIQRTGTTTASVTMNCGFVCTVYGDLYCDHEFLYYCWKGSL